MGLGDQGITGSRVVRQRLRLAALGVVGMSLCLVTLAGCFDAGRRELSVYTDTSVTVSIVFHQGDTDQALGALMAPGTSMVFGVGNLPCAGELRALESQSGRLVATQDRTGCPQGWSVTESPAPTPGSS